MPPADGQLPLGRLYLQPNELPVEASDDIRRTKRTHTIEPSVLGLKDTAIVAPEEVSLEAQVMKDRGLYFGFAHALV